MSASASAMRNTYSDDAKPISGGDAKSNWVTKNAPASGNSAFAEIVRNLWGERRHPLDARLESLFANTRRRRDNIVEHRAVLEAIQARDPAAARSAMRRHLLNAQRQRLALLREND